MHLVTAQMGISHQHPAFKYDRVLTRSCAVGQRAYRHGAFIFIRKQKVVQSLVTQGSEEPFAVWVVSSKALCFWRGIGDLHIWARKLL